MVICCWHILNVPLFAVLDSWSRAAGRHDSLYELRSNDFTDHCCRCYNGAVSLRLEGCPARLLV